MKILQILQFFSPVHGGSAEVPYRLSKELAKRGQEVTIFTSDYKSSQEYINSIPEVKVYLFRSWLNYAKFHVTPGMIKRVKKEIKNFDIIHMHNYRTFQNIVVYYYAKKYGIPYVLQAHGSVLPLFQREGLKKIFDLFFGYRILKDASKVIALTNAEAEQCKKMGVDEDKIEIVPNGIDLSEYENLPKRGGFRSKYLISDDEKIILYIGRLHKTKGIDLLVKAFVDVSKELDDARLVLVGPDDGYLSALEELIQELKVDDKVLFTGFVTNDEKMAAFVDADVFVTPSFLGFPVTFLEACACGTPIITTNNGDELDWIDDKVGYVVEYDKDQLRDAIIKVLRGEGLRKRFGEEGKRLVEERFGWDRIAEKVENVYKCTLNRR